MDEITQSFEANTYDKRRSVWKEVADELYMWISNATVKLLDKAIADS